MKMAFLLVWVVVLLFGQACAPALRPSGDRALPERSSASGRVLFFVADEMRPDLMEKYASQVLLPSYSDLMERGTRGENGLIQAFPPNSGVGWYTLGTGAFPAQHGSTNNTFHWAGENDFNGSTSWKQQHTLSLPPYFLHVN